MRVDHESAVRFALPPIAAAAVFTEVGCFRRQCADLDCDQTTQRNGNRIVSSKGSALVTSRGVLNRAWGRQGTQNNPLRFHRPKSALWLWNFLCCSDADSDGRSGFCGEIRSRAVLGVLLRVEQKPTFDADPYLQSAEVAGGGCAAARRTRRTAAAAWTMMRPFATGPHQTRLVLGVTWVVGHDSGV